MSEWAVTEEALAAMEAAAAGMEEVTEQLKQDIESLEGVFEDNENGLGAHSADIRSLIEELKEIGEGAKAPVLKLILKMTKSIGIRRRHMEENGYTPGRSR